MWHFTKQSHMHSIMSEQPIELSLVKKLLIPLKVTHPCYNMTPSSKTWFLVLLGWVNFPFSTDVINSSSRTFNCRKVLCIPTYHFYEHNLLAKTRQFFFCYKLHYMRRLVRFLRWWYFPTSNMLCNLSFLVNQIKSLCDFNPYPKHSTIKKEKSFENDVLTINDPVACSN